MDAASDDDAAMAAFALARQNARCHMRDALIEADPSLSNSNAEDPSDKEESWSSSHLKARDWKPSVDNLRQEVLWRYHAYAFGEHIKQKPKTKSWTVLRCMDWLISHPINWEDNAASLPMLQ